MAYTTFLVIALILAFSGFGGPYGSDFTLLECRDMCNSIVVVFWGVVSVGLFRIFWVLVRAFPGCPRRPALPCAGRPLEGSSALRHGRTSRDHPGWGGCSAGVPASILPAGETPTAEHLQRREKGSDRLLH